MSKGKTILVVPPLEKFMEHNRPVSQQDHEILVLLQRSVGRVVLTAVFHNGEPRQAFAILEENEEGIYLRIIGIALNPSDITQDKLGHAAAFHPPMGKTALN